MTIARWISTFAPSGRHLGREAASCEASHIFELTSHPFGHNLRSNVISRRMVQNKNEAIEGGLAKARCMNSWSGTSCGP